MKRASEKQENEYLQIGAPVLKHMHAAIAPLVQADETLLDNYNGNHMMIKVLANADEVDALYYCGLITEEGYAYYQKAAKEMEARGLTTFYEKGQKIVTPAPVEKVIKYLKKGGEYIPFEAEDLDYALMVQGAAQLFEMLHYNRSDFRTDLSKELPDKTWHLGKDKDQTANMLLFHLISLSHGLKQVLPQGKLTPKTRILLDVLTRNFYQSACFTLFSEGEMRKEACQKSHRVTSSQRFVGLKKSERMMAMGYFLEHISGESLMYGQNRQTMLQSGLVYAMREEIERGDFSKVFDSANPNKQKLGLMRKKQVLKWYDAHTAPFLKTVRQHVQTGVNKALKNLGQGTHTRM